MQPVQSPQTVGTPQRPDPAVRAVEPQQKVTLEGFLDLTSRYYRVTTQTIRSAMADLMQLIRSRVELSDLSALVKRVPEALPLMHQHTQRHYVHARIGYRAPGRPIQSMEITGRVSALVVASRRRSIQISGLSHRHIPSFVCAFMRWLEGRVGTKLVDRMVARVPELVELARA